MIDGSVEPGFEEVREQFDANFAKRGELGAACAAYHRGVKVVDLWGGRRSAGGPEPWREDTLVLVYSTSKGLAAMAVALASSRGWLDYDAPVAGYWPEFSQGGKEKVTVRQLLTHQAGLCGIDERLDAAKLADLDAVADAIARQPPAWEPGTRHGYHAMTYGHLVGEVVRRIDGRSLGSYFREEIAEPLGIDFLIGFGPEYDARCADLIAAPRDPSAPDFLEMLSKDPDSLAAKVFGGSRLDADAANGRAWRAAEIPAGNGHGSARALARLYGALARGGELDGVRVLSAEAIERANTEQVRGEDAVLKPLHTRFGVGFMMTQPMIPFGPNPRSFGHPGAGGSIAFADPDAKIGFGYVMNQMQMGLAGGAHGFALIAALYEAQGLTT